jgi:hypothetical protein
MVGTIEVRLSKLSQLFNTFDPSPFHERDLDDDAEAHIMGWAQELPTGVPVLIVIHLPEDEARKAHERGLGTAIGNYFADRAGMVDRDMRELFRLGWGYLSIGVPILVLCLIASQVVRTWFGIGPVARAVEESLIILGWVANWKPLETFLYDWWPLRRRRDLYRRLQAADLRIEVI